jgi:hypothetical protein
VTVATIEQSERDLARIVFVLRQLAEGTIADSLLATAAAAPATPIASRARLWLDATDKRLHDKNDAGAIGTTVIADAGAAHNFLTAISAAGVISKAQPAIGDLANTASTAWSPVLKFGGANTGMVTTNAGFYCRIGPLIIANFSLLLTAKGSSTGQATITGLPFADATGNGGNCAISVFTNLSGLTGAPNGRITLNGSTIILQQTSAANSVDLTDASFTNTTNLYGTATYLAG